MKKLSLLIVLLTTMVLGLQAGPVDQQSAQLLGTRFMNTTELAQRGVDVQLNLVSVQADFERGGVDYYVFNVRGGNGFVIVAGDDRVKPILAYATSGSYDPQDVAEGFQFMLNGYREEIHYIRDHNMVATPDIVAEWASAARNGQLIADRQARAVVGPLCQTKWHQNYPYNSQCPLDPEGDGGYVYAGCVATAMGQVLKFWDYPERGSGSYSYTPDGYETQTAYFGETDYHFELMPLAVDSTSTEEEYFYIAQLLHHLGISVDMMYSGHGSGATSYSVPGALQNYFGCSTGNVQTLSFWGMYYYSIEQWIQMLKDGGLDEQMPLYYSGQDDGGAGGHAFVCDGYDENDYFHFNWGWSGKDDAWCPIGAVNTTKYAFNDMNGFIDHIIPQGSLYYQRADSVAAFTVTENNDLTGVSLNWTNPSLSLNGDPLSSIESVTIRRNNQVIATLTGAEVGAAMGYEDTDLEPGLYEYAIYVTNEAGISRNAYRKVLVGEKCDVVFELHDAGGDGWKGASISVTAENGQRIAVVNMEEGYDKTVTVPLLRQNISFIWNHGWFYGQEEYDTDYECSFIVRDADGNELYVSEGLEDGVFLTYENDCETGTLTCYPVQNTEVEYVCEDGQIGVKLTWNTPIITEYLESFYVFRNHMEDPLSSIWYPVATIPFTGGNYYEFFDNFAEQEAGDYTYFVRAYYWYEANEEECSADTDYFSVIVTGVDEMEDGMMVYPNPTTGLLNVESQSAMHLTVTNLLGQKVLETEANGNTIIDLSRYDRGVYLLTIFSNNENRSVVIFRR